MALYRKKTLTEASQYVPGMEDGWTLLWPGGLFTHEKRETREAAQAYFDSMFRDPDTPHTGEPEPKVVAVIHTKEGLRAITEGDWIATGVQGERWPIKADIFAATYELVAPLCDDEGCPQHGTDHVCVEKPALTTLHHQAMTAAQAFEGAASYEETMWTGWGDCIVPPYAEMRRVKAQQAVCALRDAVEPEPQP